MTWILSGGWFADFSTYDVEVCCNAGPFIEALYSSSLFALRMFS